MRVFRWRKKAFVVLGVCVTALWLLIPWLTADRVCSPTESQQLLDQLCEDFHAGLVDGSLCPDICNKRTITFLRCANYKRGKKTLIARWKRETIVLKSKKARWSDFDSIEVTGIFPSHKDFVRMVRDSLEYGLGIHLKDFPQFAGDDVTLLTKLWSTSGAKRFLKVAKTGSADFHDAKSKSLMRSLWTLLQQNEYVVMAFLRDRTHVPAVKGTCGHFYAMEYLPHGSVLGSTLLEVAGIREDVPWKERLTVALSLLEALKSYDEEFHETLHMCDVKSDNFGISAGGAVKLLDLDTVFFTSRLRAELSSDVCASHSDCDFFDCEGRCDIGAGKCTEHRVNNNLQVLCKKLLSSDLSNTYVSLLRGAPYDIEEQLSALIAECAEPPPSGYEGGVSGDPLMQHHASVRLLDRIYNLLQKDLIHNNHS